MIVIKCELRFKSVDSNIVRILDSIVYEEDLLRFYKCSQIVFGWHGYGIGLLADTLSGISIKDIIQPLDGVTLGNDEVICLVTDFFKENYEINNLIGQNNLVIEAREFLTKYKRDINLSEILGSN